jgi:DNA-binding NarL/FixJ family response regulator
MFKVLFIDEEKETLEDFEEYVEKNTTKEQLEVFTEFPLKSVEEMIDKIFEINPDAIITDFRLNEMKEDIDYTVPYNGVDLVSEFRKIRDNFPCFVLTALDDEAVGQSEDVNIVYVKHVMYGQVEQKAKAKFLDRVVNQIEHYKFKLSSAEDELLELVKRRKSGKADVKDEERIIDLDHFLERSIDKRSSIPVEYKSLSNSDQLNQLFNKVDELINKVNESNGN